MQVSHAAPHVSPYVQQYNALKIANNNFLIRSVIANITNVGQQPQYAWGSDAAQLDQLSQTIAVLKNAYNSGQYGYERGYTGTHVDKKA